MRWLPLLILAACEPDSVAFVRSAGVEDPTPLVCNGDVCIDRVTGCQYLVREGAITPRLTSDGRPTCGR